MFEELKYIPSAWTKAFASRNFRNQFFITLMVFVLVGMHDFHYLRLWQLRPGYHIDDILLDHLRPHNFSLPIFLVEYSAILLVVVFLLPRPQKFMYGLQMASVITLARTMCIYFIALEPPRDMILLQDPFASFFLHTKDIVVTKDLFFSGHISMLALVGLMATNRYIKIWAFMATVAVAFMLLCQHVHYSLDVLCAPVVAFVAYKFVLLMHREIRIDTAWQSQEHRW